VTQSKQSFDEESTRMRNKLNRLYIHTIQDDVATKLPVIPMTENVTPLANALDVVKPEKPILSPRRNGQKYDYNVPGQLCFTQPSDST